MIALVTGGASSGKSAFAETLVLGMGGPHYYLAAMKPFGADGQRRIERHRRLRAGKGFSTVECYDGLDRVAACVRDLARYAHAESGLDGGAAVGDAVGDTIGGASVGTSRVPGTALLECLGNVVANELFDDDGMQVAELVALDAVRSWIASLADQFDNLVVVGNEVGSDGVRYGDATQVYIRILGTVSCELAQRCDTVVECICGCAHVVKGQMRG